MTGIEFDTCSFFFKSKARRMFFRLAGMWVSVYLLASVATAQDFFDSSQCDSSVIQYSWQQKYGGIHLSNSKGKSLFEEATEFMIAAAAGDDEQCAEAYLLVVEYILTSPGLGKSQLTKYEGYLVQQISAPDSKKNRMLWELIENAPTVSTLWDDYENYLESHEALLIQYEQVAASNIENYCMRDYQYDKHGGDYDTYMKDCVSKWQ